MRFILGSPTQSIPLLLKKVVFFFNQYEKPLESNYHYAKTYSPTLNRLTLGYGLILPLGLLGALLCWPRRRELALLYVFVLVYAGSVILFFVSMRYRLPVALGLFPFAAAGLQEVWTRIQQARLKPALQSLGLGALCFGVAHVPLEQANVQHDLAHTYYLLGNVYQENKDYPSSLPHYEKAVALYPQWAGFYNNLGLTYLRVDRPADALLALDKSVELGDNDRRVQRNRAKAFVALHEDARAADAYLEALKRSPGHVPTLLDLSQVLVRLGRQEEAIGTLRQALEHVKDPRQRTRIQKNLDQLEGRGGDAGQAEPGGASSGAVEESTDPGEGAE